MKDQSKYNDEENFLEGLKIICEKENLPFDDSVKVLIVILLDLIEPEEIQQYLNEIISTSPLIYNEILPLVDEFIFRQTINNLPDLMDISEDLDTYPIDTEHSVVTNTTVSEEEFYTMMNSNNSTVSQTIFETTDLYTAPPILPELYTTNCGCGDC